MSEVQEYRDSLAKTIRNYHQKGWSPATSTNYSFRTEGNEIYVSRSGLDKSNFQESDFIMVDSLGDSVDKYSDHKPSAETLIHCEIYKLFPENHVILHSHSPYSVLISEIFKNEVSFQGYEIQKGFAGQTTHDGIVNIPILENSQDMVEFTGWIRQRSNEFTNHCFVIKQHGTYAWGRNLFEAKRHLETLEYLIEVTFKKYLLKK